MPGPFLHVSATVTCAHGGQATPTVPNSRVLVSSQPTVTQPGPYAVAGCTLPPNAGGPCATAQWITAATRVFSNAMPLVLMDSQATCAPTGTPLLAVTAQARAMGA